MYDVIVIGAGPAGATAALETSYRGLKTLLIDEQLEAGGQVWRARSKSIIKPLPSRIFLILIAFLTASFSDNPKIVFAAFLG
jgi:thioredoxin reductase